MTDSEKLEMLILALNRIVHWPDLPDCYTPGEMQKVASEVLEDIEDDEWLEKVLDWYKEHKEHVDCLIENEGFKVIPSNEDINHPELWKSIHWTWFFDNVENYGIKK